MKRCFLVLGVLLMWLFGGTGARAEEPEPDWLELLLEAAVAGDREAGLAAAEGWNADESRPPLDYDELRLLSKLITWEAGSAWLTEELRLGVGEVVLNRVASPEFPDTIQGVVYQKGQYSVVNTARFAAMAPRSECVDAALRLLQGERHMVPGVVYQADYLQGELFSVYFDRRLGNTYFCLSENLDLYP